MFQKVKRHHDFMWTFAKALLTSFLRPAMTFLFFITLFLIGGSSYLFWVLEQGHNPKITDWFESAYFTVTTMTGVGYGDIYPHTTGGKALAMLLMIGGTALYVCYTALLAASLLEVEMRYRRPNKDE